MVQGIEVEHGCAVAGEAGGGNGRPAGGNGEGNGGGTGQYCGHVVIGHCIARCYQALGE